jgi:acyl-coenzyme A synthetase/AMP-(fatty) acid ligase
MRNASGEVMTHGALKAAVQALAKRLPDRPYVLNLCKDRYQFSVLFSAAVLRGQTNLLPPNVSEQTLKNLEEEYGCYRVEDGSAIWEASEANLMRPRDERGELVYPARVAGSQVEENFPAAIVFTSGSTGKPKPFVKTIKMLEEGAKRAVARFEVAPHHTIIATVPHQHMYGLETAIMLPLAGYATGYAGMPFYPTDIEQALQYSVGDSILVTTPLHLKALLLGGVDISEIYKIISATAPLSPLLASDAEKRFASGVYEIYGCTEAGSMASRRLTEGEWWRPYDDFRFYIKDKQSYVDVSYLPEPVLLGDHLMIREDGCFRLEGRNEDMVNIAGKRASLYGLNIILQGIDIIEDGIFFSRENNGQERLYAMVVLTPGATLDRAGLCALLKDHIDPVFFPRNLYLVEKLPRNEVGKVTWEALEGLLDKKGGVV